MSYRQYDVSSQNFMIQGFYCHIFCHTIRVLSYKSHTNLFYLLEFCHTFFALFSLKFIVYLDPFYENISLLFYFHRNNKTKELKEKHLSTNDRYFSPQLNKILFITSIKIIAIFLYLV